ncbi:unnamed protein product, partial [Laminaria digitata]
DWFLKISPHGKVPVLKVDEEILFESNAIAEFLDETVPPRLHPEDPIHRARNRAWTDYVPTFSSALSGVYYTKTREDMEAGLANAPKAVERLEQAIALGRGNNGPYFNGPELSLVDAAYAPFLHETVSGAVAPNFLEEFYGNLKRREFYVATLIDDEGVQAAE